MEKELRNFIIKQLIPYTTKDEIKDLVNRLDIIYKAIPDRLIQLNTKNFVVDEEKYSTEVIPTGQGMFILEITEKSAGRVLLVEFRIKQNKVIVTDVIEENDGPELDPLKKAFTKNKQYTQKEVLDVLKQTDNAYTTSVNGNTTTYTIRGIKNTFEITATPYKTKFLINKKLPNVKSTDPDYPLFTKIKALPRLVTQADIDAVLKSNKSSDQVLKLLKAFSIQGFKTDAVKGLAGKIKDPEIKAKGYTLQIGDNYLGLIPTADDKFILKLADAEPLYKSGVKSLVGKKIELKDLVTIFKADFLQTLKTSLSKAVPKGSFNISGDTLNFKYGAFTIDFTLNTGKLFVKFGGDPDFIKHVSGIPTLKNGFSTNLVKDWPTVLKDLVTEYSKPRTPFTVSNKAITVNSSLSTGVLSVEIIDNFNKANSIELTFDTTKSEIQFKQITDKSGIFDTLVDKLEDVKSISEIQDLLVKFRHNFVEVAINPIDGKITPVSKGMSEFKLTKNGSGQYLLTPIKDTLSKSEISRMKLDSLFEGTVTENAPFKVLKPAKLDSTLQIVEKGEILVIDLQDFVKAVNRKLPITDYVSEGFNIYMATVKNDKVTLSTLGSDQKKNMIGLTLGKHTYLFPWLKNVDTDVTAVLFDQQDEVKKAVKPCKVKITGSTNFRVQVIKKGVLQ